VGSLGQRLVLELEGGAEVCITLHTRGDASLVDLQELEEWLLLWAENRVVISQVIREELGEDTWVRDEEEEPPMEEEYLEPCLCGLNPCVCGSWLAAEGQQ
jgi:hypothetical protein